MKTSKFKTNINCGGCIATVTPHLNDVKGIEEWNVDTSDKDKILTVKGDFSEEDVKTKVQEAGFRIEEKRGLFSSLF
ncbi:copper chaperone [Catalinimonas alkaloidigena]|uniref:Copper chaperone n=1 Tax=Catalinimonas alkaloidigena TaxID=1075417 RepID=A0A1G9A315_9BACT|nr:heavy-metal-associated domain-containing protein [Catalinimonas alkaloidigena]SDK21637.1 copper chaperone [Catalinimonas alkaloidigena]